MTTSTRTIAAITADIADVESNLHECGQFFDMDEHFMMEWEQRLTELNDELHGVVGFITVAGETFEIDRTRTIHEVRNEVAVPVMHDVMHGAHVVVEIHNEHVMKMRAEEKFNAAWSGLMTL